LHKHKSLTGERFVRGQVDVAEWIEKVGRHRLEDVMVATAYTDIREPLARSAMELGVTAEQLADRWREILDDIPSRWVEMKLRHLRQSNPQKAWDGNDLNDVTALSIAVPYCDVVVTEKSWASMISAAKVEQPFGTVVARSLRDVVDIWPKP
jgi:hypothetical protein